MYRLEIMYQTNSVTWEGEASHINDVKIKALMFGGAIKYSIFVFDDAKKLPVFEGSFDDLAKFEKMPIPDPDLDQGDNDFGPEMDMPWHPMSDDIHDSDDLIARYFDDNENDPDEWDDGNEDDLPLPKPHQWQSTQYPWEVSDIDTDDPNFRAGYEDSQNQKPTDQTS
jgi:hypothetical protein